MNFCMWFDADIISNSEVINICHNLSPQESRQNLHKSQTASGPPSFA